MNADTSNDLTRSLEVALDRVIKDHNPAVNNLTERQLVDLLKQMIAAGDIVRYVVQEPGFEQKQCMVYEPFREVERLKAKNLALTNALRNLVLLHDEPHPGLISWSEACKDALEAGKEALLA